MIQELNVKVKAFTVYNTKQNIRSKNSSDTSVSFKALIEAVQSDNDTMVDLIIKNGINVDLSDDYGKSALHWAAFKGMFLKQ